MVFLRNHAISNQIEVGMVSAGNDPDYWRGRAEDELDISFDLVLYTARLFAFRDDGPDKRILGG